MTRLSFKKSDFALMLLLLTSYAASAELPVHAPKTNNVLFLAPHPDDEALHSGVLLRALSRGAKVTVFYLSDGESSDYMARSYFKHISSNAPIPSTSAERINAYEAIRRNEAKSGLATLEFAMGTAIQKRFFSLPNITEAAKSPASTSELRAAIEHELRNGNTAVYIPHPRDTNPGHQATVKIFKEALGRAPDKGRMIPNEIFGYIVHYGSYSGALGLRMPTREPLQTRFAYDKQELESVVLKNSEAVLKLDALLAHQTQVSRDDVLKLGSPLATGYLAGFVGAPEVFERFPANAKKIPAPHGRINRRAKEMIYRYAGPLMGSYHETDFLNAVNELSLIANRILPPGSRAVQALKEAQSLEAIVDLRTACQRLLMGPWRIK